METMPIDAIITILLYLIGAPALLIQNAESEVRFVLSHNLRRATIIQTAWPAVFGIITIFLPLALQRFVTGYVEPAWMPDLVVFILIGLAIYVSAIVLPISRKRDVVKRLRTKMVKQVEQKGHVEEEEMSALELLGTEGNPGDERGWVIRALGYISTAIIALPGYNGSRLDRVNETMRNVVLGGNKLGSPENFKSAIEILRPVIQTYFQKIKSDAWFSDADLYNAYLLLGEMGRRSMDFPVDGIASLCLEALDGSGQPNSAASQRISEIGIAAVNKDRIGPARAALHILDNMASSIAAWCENEEVMFDYLALLASFWNHSVAARVEANRQLNDLKQLEAEQPDRPDPLLETPEGQIPETRLSLLVKQAVKHQSMVNNFTISDNIRDMWISYTLD